MARSARAEVYAPDEVAVIHVTNHVVRRCYLLGNDPVSGKNFDHRKQWIEQDLKHYASCFGIDLLGYSVLSDQLHLILRSRPDVVELWDDAEVARRWLLLCPLRRDENGNPEKPDKAEIDSIRKDPKKLEEIQLRMSDVGWWVRLLCQHIAVQANHEDQQSGKFWQSRFKAVRLLDDAAILACSAHVDLHPIRAGLAKTLESSRYSSLQRRIESRTDAKGAKATSKKVSTKLTSKAQAASSRRIPTDQFLAPMPLNERSDAALGPQPNLSGVRCSNKGFLPVSVPEYLELLNWTARQRSTSRSQVIPEKSAKILKRLGLDCGTWCELVEKFDRVFGTVAGRPQTIGELRSRVNQRRYKLSKAARELLASSE